MDFAGVCAQATRIVIVSMSYLSSKGAAYSHHWNAMRQKHYLVLLSSSVGIKRNISSNDLDTFLVLAITPTT